MSLCGDVALWESNPAVVTGLIDTWPARLWTPAFLAEALQGNICRCKVAPKYSQDQIWETECAHIEATLQEFCEWTSDTVKGDNPLRHVSSDLFSCYVDYKSMSGMFDQCQDLLKSVDWSVCGLDGRGGCDSTIWIGSEGASTPCHYDTYGFNLVAQIHGRKRWHLFPPSSSECLYPTRLPYEESSVFSQVNVGHPALDTHVKFKGSEGIVVTLVPGQVLFVPRHWWHYVECLETAISINTWVEMPEDNASRVTESVTRATVSCLACGTAGEGMECWINPNEDIMSMKTNWTYILQSLTTVLNQSSGSEHSKANEQNNLSKVAKHFQKQQHTTLFAPWNIPSVTDLHSRITGDDVSDPLHPKDNASTSGSRVIADVHVEFQMGEENHDWKNAKRKLSDEGHPNDGCSDSTSVRGLGNQKKLKYDPQITDGDVKVDERSVYILQPGTFRIYYQEAHGKTLTSNGVDSLARSDSEGSEGFSTVTYTSGSINSTDECAVTSMLPSNTSAEVQNLPGSPAWVQNRGVNGPRGGSLDACHSKTSELSPVYKQDGIQIPPPPHPKAEIPGLPSSHRNVHCGDVSESNSDVPVVQNSDLSTIRELFFRSITNPRIMEVVAEELLSMYKSANK